MSSSSSEEGRSDPLTFWSRPVSPFGRFVVTRLERLFTGVQPSDPSLVRLRIQGWQGPDRCPRSFGRRITPPPVRVGTPGHHRVRGGIATSFTTLLDRPCGRMHNVYVRPLVAPGQQRGLPTRMISGLNHTAFDLAVSASQWKLPATAQDSLPAAGPALPDGIRTRRVPTKGFSL